MIYTTRPTASPVVNIVFPWNFVLLDFKKWGRTDNMCENMITTGCDCGSAEWINYYIKLTLPFKLRISSQSCRTLRMSASPESVISFALR